MAGPLVVVGDVLLDRDVDGQANRLSPDAPVPVIENATDSLRPGGAGLAALLAASQASEVVLVAPFGDDPASETVRGLLSGLVTVVSWPLCGSMQEKTRVRARGHTLLRVDHGGGVPGPAGQQAVEAIMAAGALLASDYGLGTTADSVIRNALSRRASRVPLVWDPHPRGAAPVRDTRIATPNHMEAVAAAGLGTPDGGRAPCSHHADGPRAPGGHGAVFLAAIAAGEHLLKEWPAESVAVTLGSNGALLARHGQTPLVIPATPLDASDPCGAGDQFAAITAIALHEGALVSEAVTAGVAVATRFLATGGVNSQHLARPGESRQRETRYAPEALTRESRPGTGGQRIPHHDTHQAAENVQVRGGTVVATGGCFDVLHAGHVSMLRAARSLGDWLVVCLNSDASVRRLKGPGRPLNPAADRATILAALDCVDQVEIFDEDTPERLLGQLRPSIWVKGGDYEGRELPEGAVLCRWNGRVVTVPYLSGRSTSRLASAAGGRETARQR